MIPSWGAHYSGLWGERKHVAPASRPFSPTAGRPAANDAPADDAQPHHPAGWRRGPSCRYARSMREGVGSRRRCPAMVWFWLFLGPLACSRDFAVPGEGSGPLTVTPDSLTLAPQASATFQVSGGRPPYALASLDAASGPLAEVELDETSGVGTYRPGAEGNVSDRVLLSDAEGTQVALTVAVGAALDVIPRQAYVPAGGSFRFTALGGLRPYSWSVERPDGEARGSVDEVGTYLAPFEASQEQVVVEDATGRVAVRVTVTTGPRLRLLPAAAVAAPGETVRFEPIGGTPPYGALEVVPADPSLPLGLVQVETETGSVVVDAGNDAWVACRTTACLYRIEVADAAGATAAAELEVDAPSELTVPASELAFPPGTGLTLAPSGGVPPYTAAFGPLGNLSGGRLDSSGHYEVGPNVGAVDSLQVTDALGQMAEIQVTVTAVTYAAESYLGRVSVDPTAPHRLHPTVSGGLILPGGVVDFGGAQPGLTPLPAGHVLDVFDFNGDGIDDLLVRRPDGRLLLVAGLASGDFLTVGGEVHAEDGLYLEAASGGALLLKRPSPSGAACATSLLSLDAFLEGVGDPCTGPGAEALSYDPSYLIRAEPGVAWLFMPDRAVAIGLGPGPSHVVHASCPFGQGWELYRGLDASGAPDPRLRPVALQFHPVSEQGRSNLGAREVAFIRTNGTDYQLTGCSRDPENSPIRSFPLPRVPERLLLGPVGVVTGGAKRTQANDASIALGYQGGGARLLLPHCHDRDGCVQPGGGTFSMAGVEFAEVGTWAPPDLMLAFGDVDGDGRQDAVSTSPAGDIQMRFDAPHAAWRRTALEVPRIAAGVRPGDLDAHSAVDGSGRRLLFVTIAGQLRAFAPGPLGGSARSLALLDRIEAGVDRLHLAADLDGDGAVEVLYEEGGSVFLRSLDPDRLRFRVPVQVPLPSTPDPLAGADRFAAADLDGDGRPSLLAFAHSGDVLTAVGTVDPATGATRILADNLAVAMAVPLVGEVTGDGLADLVLLEDCFEGSACPDGLTVRPGELDSAGQPVFGAPLGLSFQLGQRGRRAMLDEVRDRILVVAEDEVLRSCDPAGGTCAAWNLTGLGETGLYLRAAASLQWVEWDGSPGPELLVQQGTESRGSAGSTAVVYRAAVQGLTLLEVTHVAAVMDSRARFVPFDLDGDGREGLFVALGAPELGGRVTPVLQRVTE